MLSLMFFLMSVTEVIAVNDELYYHVSGISECINQNPLDSFTDVCPLYCGRLCFRFPDCARFLHCPDSGYCSIGGTDGGMASLQSPGCVCYTTLPNCQNGGTLTSGGTCDCPTGFHGTECQDRIRDCTDLKDLQTSDTFTSAFIFPDNAPEPFLVYCDMYGFTFLLYRRDSVCTKTSFDRSWQDYKEGFGDFDCDFWLGLDKIHYVTAQARYQLEVLIDDGCYKQCYFTPFSVGGAASNYTAKLPDTHQIPECNGLLGPDVGFGINGLPFSTRDRDSTTSGCPDRMSSGWWFEDICVVGNPNGPYITQHGYAGNPGVTRLRIGGNYTSTWIKVLFLRVKRLSG